MWRAVSPLSFTGSLKLDGSCDHWLVRIEERIVDVLRRPRGGHYTQRSSVDADDVVLADGIPGVAIPVRDLFPPE